MAEKLAYRYTFEEKTHIWSLAGPDGGVHIWATEAPDEQSQEMSALFGERFFGGVECHYRSPPYEGYSHDKPSHDDCWLIGGPCWHDGSSLYFRENIAPLLRGIEGSAVPPSLHEYLNAELLDWYRANISKEVNL